MTIAGELINILGFKLEGADNLRKFNSGMDDAERKSKGVADGMKIVGRAALGAGVAAVGFAAHAVGEFADFERVMNRIGITAGATSAETVRAADDVRRLASQMALPVEDAVTALDTLVSSGQSLEEAMAFLPSVLQTAQASGAATTDIANTALKAASALKLQASELETAFDIMIAGGKAGQFELRDMAQYIPELSNSFASLGYEGEGGLKTLIALLQTVREDTGSASGAATQLGNVFGKIYAGETANAFKKMGVDLRSEMEAARAAGEDTVAAFVRISKEAIDGDLSKLPLLFTDQEFRLGMQSLMTSADSYQRFVDAVNSSEVKGSGLRDFQRIAGDTTSEIQKMSNAWGDFTNTVGAAVAPAVSGVLGSLTDDINRQNAVMAYREGQGRNFVQRNALDEFRNPFNTDRMSPDEEARRGGYIPSGDRSAAEAARRDPEAYAEFGGDFMRPFIPEGPRTGPTNVGGLTPEQQAKRDRNAALSSSSMFAPPEVQMPQAIEITPPTEPVPATIVDAPEAWWNPIGWFGGDDGASAAPVSDNSAAAMAEVAAKVDTANACLADMTAQTPTSVDAVVTDARQDNRQFPVTVNSSVTQNITQPTAAPGAVGTATNAAVAGAINQQAARLSQEPAL